MARVLDSGLLVSDYELLYPGSLAWDIAIQNLPPPPGWRQEADSRSGDMAMLGDENGMLRTVSRAEYWENLFDNPLYETDDCLVEEAEEDAE